MQLSLHLVFAGQCEAAFTFYAQAFGGTDLGFFRYGDSPMAADVGPEWRDKIVHANLTVGGRVLMGADAPGADSDRRAGGFFAFLSCRDEREAERVFAALSDGGRIDMPLQKTFWSPCFGVLVDRFGVPWEITCDAAPAA
jgi:PhnB protein